MQNRRNEVDAVWLHPAVDDGPGARIVGDADAELEIHGLYFRVAGCNFFRSFPRKRESKVRSPLTRGRANADCQYRYGVCSQSGKAENTCGALAGAAGAR